MVHHFLLRGRLIAALTGLSLVALAACSDDDDASSPKKPIDGGSDVVTVDATSDASDATTDGTTLGICQELPQPPDIQAFLDIFTGAPDDCRIAHLYTALLGANKIQDYIDNVLSYTDGFLGCSPAPPVTGFAPGELPGVSIPLTQDDVDVILDYYMKAMVAGYKLSPTQEQTAKTELVELAKSAVKDPAPGHSLSLCPDSAGGDSGADASDDANGGDAAASDGGTNDASDAGGGG